MLLPRHDVLAVGTAARAAGYVEALRARPVVTDPVSPDLLSSWPDPEPWIRPEKLVSIRAHA
jgi:hypothetical protein